MENGESIIISKTNDEITAIKICDSNINTGMYYPSENFEKYIMVTGKQIELTKENQILFHAFAKNVEIEDLLKKSKQKLIEKLFLEEE